MNLVNDYGWQSTMPTCTNDYLKPRIFEILHSLNAKRVCDLGSGNGTLAAAMHIEGYEVCGVEYDEKGVELARLAYSDIPFFRLGVQDDPAIMLKEDGRLFDVVVSTEVIEHLYSPHHLPMFARKILPLGGYLVISTPYHGYLKNLVLALFGKWDQHHTALWHGGHIKFWSRKTLTRLLRDHGFEVVAFYGAGRFIGLWKSMILVAKTL